MPARACPKCRNLMEVPTNLLTQEVECPSCDATFTPDAPRLATVLAAKPSVAGSSGISARPSRKADEDDDDDDSPRRSRRRRDEEEGSGSNKPVVAAVGGGGTLLIIIAIIVLKVFLRANRHRDYDDEPATPSQTPNSLVQNPGPQQPPIRPGATAIPESKKFTAQGVVSVMIPGDPLMKPVAPTIGVSTSAFESAAPDESWMFGLFVGTFRMSLPQAQLDQMLVNQANGFATKAGGRLTGLTTVNVPRATGKDYTVALNKGGTLHMRILFFDISTTRPVMVLLAAGGQAVSDADWNRYISSLEVTQPPVTQPPVTQPPITQPPIPQPPKPQPPKPQPPKPKSDLPDGWERYEFPDKSAVVAMPGKATPNVTQLAPGLGLASAEVTSPDKSLHYAIGFSSEVTNRKDGPNSCAYLRFARNNLQRTFGRKPDRETPVTLGDLSGTELEYVNKEGQGMRVRFFKIVNQRETRVYAITLTGTLPPAEEKSTFVDTFKINWPTGGRPAPPPAPNPGLPPNSKITQAEGN